MKRWARRLAPAFVGAAALVLTIAAGTAIANHDGRPVGRVVMFASDGMRPDLMERYADQGFMPTYKTLMNNGAVGKNGMVQAFPPNTGVGWYTMATGTYPSEHGSTNNTFFRGGDSFANRTSFSGGGVLQADTIANAAERAGKKVAQIDWVGGIPANINGPTVDFATFYTNRGVRVGMADSVEAAGAAAFGTNYEAGLPVAASGWIGVPTGDPAAPAKEASWSIPTSVFGCGVPSPPATCTNTNRTYNVYFYDSSVDGTAAYDHAIVATKGKTDTTGRLDLGVGDFKGVKLTLSGTRAGQLAGQYIKLISLASDATNFKLYATSIARAAATCRTAACNALPHLAGEDPLEAHIANNLPPWAAADFAPLEGGVIDEDTYVEQGRDLERTYSLAVINYILGTLQPGTDFAMVGYPFTDEVSHQFMGLVSPTDIDGNPNPCYDVTPKFDDVACTGRGTANRVAQREGYIRSAYADADEKLGIVRSLMGGNPTTFAGADHGFAPAYYAVNANKVLNDATVGGVSLHVGGSSASNCSAIVPPTTTPPTPVTAANTDLTKACWAGGTIQIYINPARLKSSANPSFPTYDEVRTAVRNAFLALNTSSRQPVSQVLNKEDLRNVDGSDSLHPNRSGDVVVILRPPYQSDAGTNGQAIALSHFFGQHGFAPNLVDITNNVNMHAAFVMSGPGIKQAQDVEGLRAIDVAPTIAFLMNIPGPQNARGKILYPIVEGTSQLREVDVLDISDYHGQLVPMTEQSDSLGPFFDIGGSAFLKPWFAVYRAEAPSGSLVVAGGDSVGASPPISSFFGEKTTIEFMNRMGVDLDGLGNHNFDRGEQYLRNELIPLAKFKYVSANIVDPATGEPPGEWSKSRVFQFGDFKVGIVGFSNTDIAELTKPGSLGPFVVNDPLAAVNKRAAQLRKQSGLAAVVALGHLGATGPIGSGTTAANGALLAPTGPLLDLADGTTNVDAVIGDHTNFQVVSRRSNGVLVTENLSKGARITRLRLVIDPIAKQVVYTTADFHKPWNIGVTADPQIQARVNELNAILAPQLGVVVGQSTVAVPRSDACGQSAGRTCESKIGNVIADALRTSQGAQFAITNSGGIRDQLTCPAAGGGTGFCPASSPPPFPITRGQVLTVLPFGNFAVTVKVNGAELKTMLENGVSQMVNPMTQEIAAAGRFPQVSGLCFTYDIAAPASSRVVGATPQNPDGTCATSPNLLAEPNRVLSVAINDFMSTGGDGYPSSYPGGATSNGDVMADVVEDYIAGAPSSTISPSIQGRIACVDSNAATLPNCPVVTP